MSEPLTTEPSPSAPRRSFPKPTSRRDRDSIINSSAKGWSPLQINKRDSPLKHSAEVSTPSITTAASPRRTSSSFKHVTKNSLVSNSPFKSSTTTPTLPSSSQSVLHEKRTGASYVPAKGVAPAAVVGLGISATRSTSASRARSASGNGSAAAGTRKVSAEKKVVFPSSERKTSGSRTANVENESPDIRSTTGRKPRSSMGLKGLAQNNLVSRSPFLERDSPDVGGQNSGVFTGPSPDRYESPLGKAGLRNSTSSSPRGQSLVQKEDVFSSPSPVRAQRQPSGGTPMRRSSRGSLGSPDRLPRGVSPAAPSPLGQLAPPDLAPVFSSANQITPTKSSITSRRLRGPRISGPQDTPTSARKTVTFQSVPHVREFELESVDGSPIRDDHLHGLDEEWEDEEESMLVRDNSLDALVLEQRPLSKSASHDTLDDAYRSFSLSQSQSDLSVFSGGEAHDESATADFVHTLIEEGLFSPPQMATPAFEDQPSFSAGLPELNVSLGDEHSHPSPPFLDTPSMGDSIHGGTPFMEGMAFDEVGIPFGRTHHAERAALAHSLPPTVKVSPLEQPDLPLEGARDIGHMLFNADASQPAIAAPRQTVAEDEPHAHQVGPLPDPFITVQTITHSSEERTEGGIPLGRTSHAERSKAARMLATQGLGIGMPRSPATMRPTRSAPEVDSFEAQSEDGTSIASSEAGDELPRVQPRLLFEISPEEEEILRKQRERDEMLEMETKILEQVQSRDEARRTLPKPPKPRQLRLPSPVGSPEPVQEQLPRATSPFKTKKFDLSVPFSLPFIGITSPLFNSGVASFDEAPPLPSADPLPMMSGLTLDTNSTQQPTPPPTLQISPPLTPPRSLQQPVEEDSPHRIPDFHFEPISLHSPTMAKAIATPLPPTPNRSSSAATASYRLLSAAEPEASSSTSLSAIAEASGSTNTRVRQRISREMIRKTLEQRKADGSLSKRTSQQTMSLSELEITPELQHSVPPALPAVEVRTVSTNTTKVAQASLRMDSTARPGMRPRSQTQSAHDVLMESQRNGELDEPKSALDRLMRIEGAGDLSGTSVTRHDWMKAGPSANDLNVTDSEDEVSSKPSDATAVVLAPPVEIKPLRSTFNSNFDTNSMLPPPVPNKAVTADATSAREAAINARRKEKMRDASSSSRASRRRSLSTGDVGDEGDKVKSYRHSVAVDRRLTLGSDVDDACSFVDSIREGTVNIGSERGYKLRPEKPVVKASSDDKIKHNRGGDLDTGRAWRQLRRPSDMNEYAAEIRAMKSKDSNQGKTFGNIFVKVLGIEGVQLPIPEEKTHFCITLDNGIDYIRTPFAVLGPAVKVNQEFSLVERPNFEFTLSMEIRRDPHIMRLAEQSGARPASLAIPTTPTSKSGGLRSLFHSPRKPSKANAPGRSSTPVPPTLAPTNADNISKYFASANGCTVAKTHVAFKAIARNCDAKVLEIRYPMFAMFKGEPERGNTAGGPPNAARKQVAKITLQIFRLPPIPGLSQDKLPQSIDDCLRGMRHHAWHENLYYTSVMTQIGGDCLMPKRRMFRLVGGNLIASNEVTKKEVLSIDLRKAILLVDCNSTATASSAIGSASRPRNSDEGLATRPRSIRLDFHEDDSIVFSCDNDQDKAKWLEALNAMIGHIPSNPLWAELLAARRKAAAAHKSRSASSSSLSKSASSKGMARRASSSSKPK